VFRIPVCEIDDNLEGVWLGIRRQCQLRTQSVDGARWIQAASVAPGDIIFAPSPSTGRVGEGEGKNCHTTNRPKPPLDPPANGGKKGCLATIAANILTNATVKQIDFEWSEELVYDLHVASAHSCLTEVCLVHD
jgi:hypothetical protein